jgi:hypothetical protein
MSKREALDIIMDLALGNMCDRDKMPEEHTRQAQAMDIVLAMAQES